MLEIYKEEDHHLLARVTLTEANLVYAGTFKQELISLLENKPKNMVLDMQQVAYIDSSFLGALVAGLKHAIASRHDIVLINLQKDIEDLLKLIRLDRVFKIYSSYGNVPPELL